MIASVKSNKNVESLECPTTSLPVQRNELLLLNARSSQGITEGKKITKAAWYKWTNLVTCARNKFFRLSSELIISFNTHETHTSSGLLEVVTPDSRFFVAGRDNAAQ
jgi:hypothetical protein